MLSNSVVWGEKWREEIPEVMGRVCNGPRENVLQPASDQIRIVWSAVPPPVASRRGSQGAQARD